MTENEQIVNEAKEYLKRRALNVPDEKLDDFREELLAKVNDMINNSNKSQRIRLEENLTKEIKKTMNFKKKLVLVALIVGGISIAESLGYAITEKRIIIDLIFSLF